VSLGHKRFVKSNVGTNAGNKRLNVLNQYEHNLLYKNAKRNNPHDTHNLVHFQTNHLW
jgi:hypothetical protein